MRRAVERSISTVSWSSPTAAAKSARLASSVPSIRSSKLFSEMRSTTTGASPDRRRSRFR